MISVIIPTYKGASSLSRAIESVLMQEEIEFQIIVVDDNYPESKERKETEYIMRKYENRKNVKYIKHPKNMNGSTARNTGIRAADGEIISFLDDDDFYLPYRLKKCYIRMKETDADIIYTDVLIVKNNIISDYIKALVEGNLFTNLLVNENIFGTGSNLFIKRELITRNGGFNEKLPRQQDYEFLLRQFSKGAIAVPINECLLVKSMNNTNNSVSYEVLKKIKYSLLCTFCEQIKGLKPELRKNALIAQHKELLHTAEISSYQIGIKEQKNALSKLGYKYTISDRLSEILLSSKMHILFQKTVWKLRGHILRRKYKYICNYALDFSTNSNG